MKITSKQFKGIVKEEYALTLRELGDDSGMEYYTDPDDDYDDEDYDDEEWSETIEYAMGELPYIDDGIEFYRDRGNKGDANKLQKFKDIALAALKAGDEAPKSLTKLARRMDTSVYEYIPDGVLRWSGS